VGKRIEDLHLNDSPIEVTVERQEARQERLFGGVSDVPDERDQPWYQFVGEIDDLLAVGTYLWAHDSLTGIRETVEKTRRVSEGQRRAVTNIANRGEERERGKGSRRYEGFETRRGW
jgi:hypothetical protein